MRSVATCKRRRSSTEAGSILPFLAEAAHRRFGQLFSRSGVRRWAVREGYYHQTAVETRKGYVRWESAGPGALCTMTPPIIGGCRAWTGIKI